MAPCSSSTPHSPLLPLFPLLCWVVSLAQQAEIYRFKKNFKKYSGEINSLRVHRNMRCVSLKLILTVLRAVIDSMFVYGFAGPAQGWNLFQKKEGCRKWSVDFEAGDVTPRYRHLFILALEVEETFKQSLSPLLFYCFSGNKKLLLKVPLACTKAAPVDLTMKFISKFNNSFTNRGCLLRVILKAWYGFKEKRAHKVRDMQVFLQNVQNVISKILTMF